MIHIQTNTIRAFHVLWGAKTSTTPVYVPEGDYLAEGDKLTPLLDSGAASDKHAYIVTQ